MPSTPAKPKMKNNWKKLSSRTVFKNPYYQIRRDYVIKPNGTKGFYDVIIRHPSVFIVAVNKKREACLIELYRYTNQINSLEIPAGNSEGQPPLVAAKKELLEETGAVKQ